MQALEFWKTITVDKSNLLEQLIGLFELHGIHYCVIGGQAVNAYVEPVVSLDLDLVVALESFDQAEQLLSAQFEVKRFPHRLNASLPGSDVRVQIQTDVRYFDYVERATPQEVLGLVLPVASVEDVLQGKVWAFQDPKRRGSERQKDLADIARLVEEYPALRVRIPAEILERLL